MDALQTFKDIFWDSFHRPALESPALKSIWEAQEPINDLLAGPFYAIYEQGNCNYLFDDKQRFPDIHGPDDFLNWCIYHIEKYKEGIESYVAENEAEVHDKKILLYQTDLKMELADLAYAITKENFLKKNG